MFLNYDMRSRGVGLLFDTKRSRMTQGTYLEHPKIIFSDLYLIKLQCSSNHLVDVANFPCFHLRLILYKFCDIFLTNVSNMVDALRPCGRAHKCMGRIRNKVVNGVIICLKD